MKRMAGVLMTIVFVLVSASGFAFAETGAAEIKERALYNGITFFDMREHPVCAGQEGTTIANAGSKTPLFNGITFFDQSDERTSCARISVKPGTWASNGITVFQ